MVLDSSVIVSIHLREPGYQILFDKIASSQVVVVGAHTLFETAMVLTGRKGQDSRSVVSAFLRRIKADVVPFNEQHLDAAVTAFIRFGRG